MTQAHLTTRDNSKIQIEFLDNPFVDEFVAHLKIIKDLFKLSSRPQTIPPAHCQSWGSTRVERCQQDIVDAVNRLNTLGLKFPIPVEEIVFKQGEYDSRQLLNRLHRHFTTSHRSVSHNEPVYTWQDNTDFTFELDFSQVDEFTQQVHRINTAVHSIEPFYVGGTDIRGNMRIRRFPYHTEYQVLFDSFRPIDPANNPQDIYFQDIKQEHYQYASDKVDYDVWLPLHQIQGKNYWVCYFDDDNPTHWDVSINVQYSGSMSLGDRSAAKEPILLDWLRGWGIEPGPLQCGFPLGHITAGKDLVPALKENDIIGIEIVE